MSFMKKEMLLTQFFKAEAKKTILAEDESRKLLEAIIRGVQSFQEVEIDRVIDDLDE